MRVLFASCKPFHAFFYTLEDTHALLYTVQDMLQKRAIPMENKFTNGKAGMDN